MKAGADFPASATPRQPLGVACNSQRGEASSAKEISALPVEGGAIHVETGPRPSHDFSGHWQVFRVELGHDAIKGSPHSRHIPGHALRRLAIANQKGGLESKIAGFGELQIERPILAAAGVIADKTLVPTSDRFEHAIDAEADAGIADEIAEDKCRPNIALI